MSFGPGFTDGVTNTVYPSKSLLVRALTSESFSRKLYFLSASLSVIINSFTSTAHVTFRIVLYIHDKRRITNKMRMRTLKGFNSV